VGALLGRPSEFGGFTVSKEEYFFAKKDLIFASA
jgi:hypothetical protein